jgi:hypothetical protein
MSFLGLNHIQTGTSLFISDTFSYKLNTLSSPQETRVMWRKKKTLKDYYKNYDTTMITYVNA